MNQNERYRLNLMKRAILGATSNVSPDSILVWINYVESGNKEIKGFGKISSEFLDQLKQEIKNNE